MIASGPMLSAWIAFPLAAITMTIIAAHASALVHIKMPESRRRIRRANGMLMLIAVPMIAYAFSGVGSDRPRAFVMVWSTSSALLAIIILVALVDMLNTARLHWGQSRVLRKHLREARAGLLIAARERVTAQERALAHDGSRGRFTGDGTRGYEPGE